MRFENLSFVSLIFSHFIIVLSSHFDHFLSIYRVFQMIKKGTATFAALLPSILSKVTFPTSLRYVAQ